MTLVHFQDWLRAQGFKRRGLASYTWTHGPGVGVYKFQLLKDRVVLLARLPTPEVLRNYVIGMQTWCTIASAPWEDLEFERDKLRGLKLKN